MFLYFLTFGICADSTTDSNSTCPIMGSGCKFVTTNNETIPNNANIQIPFNTTCNILLTQCFTYSCYAIFDLTQFLKWGYAPKQKYSFFSSANLSATYRLSDSGIVFKPTRSSVWVNFTTKTPDQFFELHPYQSAEDTSESYNISQVFDGMPFCNDM